MSSPADKKPERTSVVRPHNLSLGRYSVTEGSHEETPFEKPREDGRHTSSRPPPPTSGVIERAARASDRAPASSRRAPEPRDHGSERRIAEIEPITQGARPPSVPPRALAPTTPHEAFARPVTPHEAFARPVTPHEAFARPVTPQPAFARPSTPHAAFARPSTPQGPIPVPTFTSRAHADALARLEPSHTIVETPHGIFVQSPDPVGLEPAGPRTSTARIAAVVVALVAVIAGFAALAISEMGGR